MPDLKDGESTEIQGSGKNPYVIKNVGGVYSCTCPAWRNQSLGIEKRSCKHIRKLRGDAAEKERVGNALPAKRESKEKKGGPPLLLAHRWENDVDLVDWWMSEKLDGVRAYWDGSKFLSRQGNEFHAPDWFVAGLPKTALDGELWMDRKAFQKTVSVVRRQDKSDHWKQIRYVVFDAPSIEEPFETRLKAVSDAVNSAGSEFVKALEHFRCDGLGHLREELARIESLGGEGLMLREPASAYEIGRSMTLLKVKTFHDAEAVVIDHAAGKGRHKGRLGALVVQLEDGTEFNVGTGFTDKLRDSPPEIGLTITFRYQEFSDAGVPRFPSFVRTGTDAQAATKKKSVKKKAARSSSAKKAAQKKTAAKTNTTSAAARYFELVDGKSSKYWEITIDETDVTVRYGRIGTDGQSKTKSFGDKEATLKHADKLIDQKTGKGYKES
jgi:DNA ligase 1